MKSFCLGLLVLGCMSTTQAGSHNTFRKVRPRIGQQGTKVEMTLVGNGNYLHDVEQVFFYRPGIKAIDIQPRTKSQVKCTFVIAPDCPLGEHPFRVRTATEMSMVATFNVTRFPVIDEIEKDKTTGERNNSIEHATPVPTNIAVRGVIDNQKTGDRDIYRIAVEPGQRLSVEVSCVRTSDVAMTHGIELKGSDLRLRVLDGKGKLLAENDDNILHLQDPVLSFVVPENTGDSVYVEIQRSAFSTWPAPYIVHIGDFSRPLAIYPAGGKSGEPLNVKLIGDPLGNVEQTIALSESKETIAHYGDSPTPLYLRCRAFGNVLEKANAPETKVPQLPIALNGIIETNSESDRFRVSVKEGKRYRVRVFASTLASPLQPHLKIIPIESDGAPGEPEITSFSATHDDRDLFGVRAYRTVRDALDPSVIWQPKRDGDYWIEMSDLTNRGTPVSVYRIEIEEPIDTIHIVPRVTLYWWEAPQFGLFMVPQGKRWTMTVQLKNEQGTTFKGETEIVAHDLPKGVSLLSNRIPAGASKWPIQFIAASDAKPTIVPLNLEVRSLDPDKPIRSRMQRNLPFLNSPGGDAWKTVRLDQFAIAVTDPSPFSIHVEQPSVSIVRGGELALPVTIKRQEGCDEKIGFRCDWIPKDIGVPPLTEVAGDETESSLRLSAKSNAALGERLLVVTGTTIERGPIGYLDMNQVRVSTPFIKINIVEPFVELTSSPTAVRRGGRVEMKWQVAQKTPFEGDAEVMLLGLPKGVKLLEPLPAINRGTKEFTFSLQATGEALLGAVNNLTCEVTVKQNGQDVKQRSGKGVLRIDPALATAKKQR